MDNVTIKQFALKYLTDRGMFDSQAEATLEVWLNHISTTDNGYTREHLNSPISDYPDMMTTVWAMGLDMAALEWIDANLPEAFYRSMFVSATTASK